MILVFPQDLAEEGEGGGEKGVGNGGRCVWGIFEEREKERRKKERKKEKEKEQKAKTNLLIEKQPTKKPNTREESIPKEQHPQHQGSQKRIKRIVWPYS